MSRKSKATPSLVADLPGVTSLSTDEMQQIDGGWRATLLIAMGWTPLQQTYMDKNGMCYTKTVWMPPKPL